MEKNTLFERINDWAKRSVTLKLLIIGFLILVLMIPTSMMTSLIRERERIRDEATDEVSAKWGGTQTLGGPVLSIPYKSYLKDNQGKTETVIRYAHFLPDQLNVEGSIQPEARHRGIYVVVLYNARLRISGTFPQPDLSKLPIPASDFLLNDAFISLGITDMKGIKNTISFRMNGQDYDFNPGIPSNDIFASGLHFPLRLNTDTTHAFQYDLQLNGSKYLHFLPFGKETNVSLRAPWNNPSFEGSFLPTQRTVDADGFKAEWKVLHLNRNYPQQGLGRYIGNTEDRQSYRDEEVYASTVDRVADLSDAAPFGVRLLLPLDEYQKTMRSAKYKEMFICLTFLAFFFVEIINRRRIHPIQYLLIGFAICLFYILLLSLSEHLAFDLAYWISCLAIIVLITFYTWGIFRNRLVTGMIAGMLLLLYGFFYSLLQLADYALLMGSLGLLVILAGIMALTRNFDWYHIQEPAERIGKQEDAKADG